MAEHVALDLPLSARYASTIRAVAASMAADAGFSIDDIDDLRLGVNEAVSVLTDVEGDVAGRLQIRFDVDPGVIRMAASRAGIAEPVTAADLDVLATRILHAVVDEFDVDGVGVFTVVKRASGDGHD